MKKAGVAIVIFVSLAFARDPVFGQDSLPDYAPVSPAKLFYRFEPDLAGCFINHYGIDYLAGGLATFGMVKTGIDWKWYRLSVENPWLNRAGLPGFYGETLIQTAGPVGLYLLGLHQRNPDLQVTALALAQASLLAVTITSAIKVFTGRVPPYNLSELNDYSGDFRFGFLRGGIRDGWPSGHTAGAFALATTLITLYPGHPAVTIGSLAYATFIGLSVSTNVHWASDVVAGALIGWVVGETVGHSFRRLLTPPQTGKSAMNLSLTPTGIVISF
jgi:membrane-associated phospholipid phosphatase